MKLQQAIKTMEKAGWTYIRKEREEVYGEWMEYIFRDPKGNNKAFMLGDLRRRAEREGWNLWTKQVQEELAFGIQDELFDTEDYITA